MAESNFVDYVKIYCRSGKGGRGSVHMHRAKYMPNGGPDGGNGGRGGHVILRGNRNYWTLLHLRYERHVFAGHGGNGGKAKSTGAQGEDKYIDVPCGTVVYDAETGKYICDVTEHGQEVILLKGGRGGLGNWEFRTATRQAPRFAQPGEPMQEMLVILELKLLADVGLVGFPNAGKSTLLSAVSSAKPKIGNYPFTTLEPSLGIVSYRDSQSFVMADIPGIIEGASEGKGLGLRFLRHIERNSLLLFMVPGDTDDIKHEYEVLLNELATFNPDMLDKQRVLAITKADLLDDELVQLLEETLPDDVPHVFISAVTGMGIQTLKDLLWVAMNSESNKLHDIQSEKIVHKDKDMSFLRNELEDLGEDEDLKHWGEEPDEDDLELEWDDEENPEWVDDGEVVEVDWDDVEDLEDFEYEDDPEDKK
ncbi:MAG: GTPase ObgE [Bacteroidaceae bacterium]|nr:GTPase ObgE [Bacteroidaceae bacterium]